jgi:predicted O-methyltransferase YrrM
MSDGPSDGRIIHLARRLRLTKVARRLPIVHQFAARWDQLHEDLATRNNQMLGAGSRVETVDAGSEAPPVDEPPPLFVPLGHFTSPIPSSADIKAHGCRPSSKPVTELPGLDLCASNQLDLLARLSTFYGEQPFEEEPHPGLRYYFQNGYFTYADAIFLYCMLREFKPRRVIEVGSGFSTAVILDTTERFFDTEVSLTCIEPYPDRLRSLTQPGDQARLSLIETDLQSVDPAVFAQLEADDFLFIDSTHVSKLGSDVNQLVLEILASLRPGVLIHFHDIFYPFEYPDPWIEQNRAWNEAYLVRAFLEFNSAFEIVLFNDMLGQLHRDVLERDFPLALKYTGGSLWIRRKR